MASEESRTFMLDKALVSNLATEDLFLRDEAAAQLPEALSRAEVDDVAMQVSLVPGVEAVRRGEKLEREILLYLGCAALIKRTDLVTASSAAKELLSRWDVAGFVVLSLALRKARRNIVSNMLDIGSADS